jgi:hypothetical protein
VNGGKYLVAAVSRRFSVFLLSPLASATGDADD